MFSSGSICQSQELWCSLLLGTPHHNSQPVQAAQHCFRSTASTCLFCRLNDSVIAAMQVRGGTNGHCQRSQERKHSSMPYRRPRHGCLLSLTTYALPKKCCSHHLPCITTTFGEGYRSVRYPESLAPSLTMHRFGGTR